METVIDGNRKRQRTQYRKHNQEERAQRVYNQPRRLKEHFQQFPEPVPDGLLDIVRRPVHVHTRHSHHVGGRPAQFFQLPVKFLVRCEVSRFGASHQGFIFQSVFLRPVLVHVESLRFHKLVAPFHHWRQHRVDSPQHERGKEHDAQPQRKGAQERVHVYGFGTCERLPHFGGYIEQRTQPGYPFRYPRHVAAQGHHFIVQNSQHLVQVVKIHCC